jgi:hypothetical protein
VLQFYFLSLKSVIVNRPALGFNPPIYLAEKLQSVVMSVSISEKWLD